MKTLAPIAILAVDDSPKDRELLAMALELARDREFAVILLDCKMPGMDGFETASRIRSLEGRGTTPIIFITGTYHSIQHKFAGYERDAVDHLEKPTEPYILRAMVWVSIELYHQSPELREALSQVKTLTATLPMCAGCKRIRDENGEWKALEAYLEEHAGSRVSHGMCPECMKKHYPEYRT